MIWIDCSPQSGREMRDRHPLMVMSPRAFNDRTGIVIGLPMTSAPANETNPFAVKLARRGGRGGYILAHQPKSFDWRARGARPHPLKTVPSAAYAAARDVLAQIIALDPG
jgi:mRNA interferase MazF